MPHIVLIDGGLSCILSLNVFLNSCGYDVTTVSIQDCVGLSEPVNPCSLYIECVHSMDQAAIRCIESIRARDNIPIIVISSGRKATDVVAALDAGANDYVGTPYSKEILNARIKVQLRDAR